MHGDTKINTTTENGAFCNFDSNLRAFTNGVYLTFIIFRGPASIPPFGLHYPRS